MCKISVIMPIYNCERYLKVAIDSVLNQTYDNLEIILIDDGSTDGSLSICKNYLKKSNKIKLIKTKNMGVSHARNLGIKKATGEHLYFMDADDLINYNLFKDFISLNINKDDLYSFNWIKFDKNDFSTLENKTNFPTNIDDTETFKNNEENVLLNEKISGYVWNKIYSSNIIKKFNIKFDENINYCEDKLFNYEYCKHINEIVYSKAPYYFYRMRKSSASGKYLNRKNKSVMEAIEYLIKISSNSKVKDYYTWLYLINSYKFNVLLSKDWKNKRTKLIFSRNIGVLKKFKMIFGNWLYKIKKENKNNNYFE